MTDTFHIDQVFFMRLAYEDAFNELCRKYHGIELAVKKQYG